MSYPRIRPVESKHGRGKVHIGSWTSIPKAWGDRLTGFATACGVPLIKNAKPYNDTGEVNCPECLHRLGLLKHTGESA